jgi:uncharacterized membrane protein YgcG
MPRPAAAARSATPGAGPRARAGRAFLAGFLFAAVLLGPPVPPLAAQERTLVIERFHADITVLRDGRLTVSEAITVRFTGSWNGIFRMVPVEYRTPYGANYTLFLDVHGITDDGGNTLEWEESRSGGNRVFKIWVPGAADATRTIVLRYGVRNGLRFFEEHDELYWNVTGDESEFPIEAGSASVVLPPEVTGLRATAYVGPYGSTEQSAAIRQTANVVEFATQRPLRFREGLTVVVGWNPGAVDRPTRLDRARDFFASNLVFAFPLLAFAFMLWLWRRHGRDPEPGSIVPRFEPPAGLRPAEAGTLLDTRPDMRDVTASLVDLAVRGFLTIEETDEPKLFGLIQNRGFRFESKGAYRDADLKPFERKLLDALFTDGRRSSVTTDDLENSFYRDLPGIRTELSQTLTRDGHYRRHPNSVRAFFVVVAIAAGFAVVLVGAALASRFGQQPGPAVLAGLLSGLAILGLGLVMPARTIKGARTVEQILGFIEFLNRVEKDRLDRTVHTPEMFERYLPYAMAFGVEKRWARAFADICQSPPEWYRGTLPRVFVVPEFTSNLGRMAAVTGTAMQSAPRSSGSSGFGGGGGGGGGGGFSGGGFGGGGVGGF